MLMREILCHNVAEWINLQSGNPRTSLIHVSHDIRRSDKVSPTSLRHVAVSVFENWMHWLVGLPERSLLSVSISGWGRPDKESMTAVSVETNEFLSRRFLIRSSSGDAEIFRVIRFGPVLEIPDELQLQLCIKVSSWPLLLDCAASSVFINMVQDRCNWVFLSYNLCRV